MGDGEERMRDSATGRLKDETEIRWRARLREREMVRQRDSETER